MDTVEKGKSKSSFVTGDLMLDSVFSSKNITRIGTWHVRTLQQTGRLAQLLQELDIYGLDILGVSEVRWTGSGRLISDGKTVLFSGPERRHERGVGIVLSKRAANSLVSWEPVSDRIITARFRTRHTRVAIIQVYALTEDATVEEKDDFYERLQDTIDEIPRRDLKLVLGDFNAQVGGDRNIMEKSVGAFASSDHLSNNGERLVSFCDFNDLCIANTFFFHRGIHKKTWRSPNSTTANEIDHICINRKWRTSVHDACVYRGADVGTDHYLVRATLKLKLKLQKRPVVRRPYDVEKFKNRTTARNFCVQLRNRFSMLAECESIDEHWEAVKTALCESAEVTIGRRRGKRKEQFIYLFIYLSQHTKEVDKQNM
ncbi:unnamed protein product [Heligmosomoides polygyrus]|uniref:Endo/exonuclease/phosphatase domain-containing protein n=1 Tax=Heligmosomoides polygyrus TaxID=6339 RepID=A0A183GTL8_HELPZ|nr:unnamed protein product [Heligmosomoides polygyrus]